MSAGAAFPPVLERVSPLMFANGLRARMGPWRARAVVERYGEDRVRALAALIVACPTEHLLEVLGEQTLRRATLSERVGAVDWLVWVAGEYLGLATSACLAAVDAADTATAPKRLDGRLVLVDDPLAELPLQPLAADIASRLGGLTVTLAELDHLTGGVYAPRDDEPDLIILSPALLELGHELAYTWAHELGHALNVALEITSAGTGNRESSEHLADDLAEILLEHQPTTIAGTIPLVCTAPAAEIVDKTAAAEAILDFATWTASFAS